MAQPRGSNADRLRGQFQLAQALHRKGRLADAEAIYQEILRLQPRHADALHYLGLIALQTSQAKLGVRLIEQAIALKPNYAEALGNLGIGYAEMGRTRDALASYDRALALKPDLADAHDNRGNALRELGCCEAAVASHDKAIALRPSDAGAFSNRGNALRDLRRLQEALASYDRAIALQPDFLEVRCNRAIVLQACGRYHQALTGFDEVIARAQDYTDAHYGRANVLQELRRHEAALDSFDKVIALQPDHAEAHNGRGNALRELRRNQDALASYARALALRPELPGTYYNVGVTLALDHRQEAAVINYDRAIALKPDYADAYRARGIALTALKRHNETLASYARAFELDPDLAWLRGDVISARKRICDWTSDQAHLVDLGARIELGQPAAQPFVVMGCSDSPALHKKAAEIFARRLYPANEELPELPLHPGDTTIRIGYFSADFHDHPMMHVMIDLFSCHDRSRFEVIAFSFGPERLDDWRRRVVDIVDRFIDVRAMSDRDVALLARRLRIDIAVDLMGFTDGCRPGVFASRAAPVQAAYLGYPGTMGASYIDYIIADRMLIPAGSETHYCEKIVFLPETYQVNDRHRPISSRIFTKTEQKLPDTGFVFCCFNSNYKITPGVFDCWMRILRRAEGSVLWLYEENPFAASNLKREAWARNVSPDRLVFAQKLPSADHLARHRLADLFLDTLPYNAHVTASDALWAGLPVLTHIGETFAGRVAASLLNAIGLPELVATTRGAYETLAIDLATSPDRLHALRSKLAHNRLTTALFDTAHFTPHLEAAYMAMHARARAGLAPAHIDIGDGPDALHDPTAVRRKSAEGTDA